VKFILLGNTNPESPFGPIPPKVPSTIEAIRKENPVFAIHLGDMVFGGSEWMGVKSSDVTRQFKNMFGLFSRERIILYPVIGELDRHDGSALLFSLHARRPEYYSFNYGNLHFVMLNTNDPKPGSVGDTQLRWLKDDLRENKNASSVFVFTHHPLRAPAKPRYGERVVVVENAGRILETLKEYPVKAIFSGHLRGYYDEQIEDIRFIIAGCGGYGKEYDHWKHNHYYLVNFSGGLLSVTEKKVN